MFFMVFLHGSSRWSLLFCILSSLVCIGSQQKQVFGDVLFKGSVPQWLTDLNLFWGGWFSY